MNHVKLIESEGKSNELAQMFMTIEPFSPLQLKRFRTEARNKENLNNEVEQE